MNCGIRGNDNFYIIVFIFTKKLYKKPKIDYVLMYSGICVGQDNSVFFELSWNFRVTMRNFQFLLILAPPLDKSSSNTNAYCHTDL